MRLLRSGDGVTTGELVDLATLAELARRWYGDRLDPEWRPRTLEASQAILASVGLTGEFWSLR
jgi:hypothetical protein